MRGSAGVQGRRCALKAVIAGALALGGLTALAPAAQASPSYGTWSAIGPGTLTVADGTAGPPSLHYDLDPAGYGAQSWYFRTTQLAAVPGGATVDVPWDYSGNHAYFHVTESIEAYVSTEGGTTYYPLQSAGPADCCTPPSGGFSVNGTFHFTGLYPGDTYGFRLTGSNFDYNNFLKGTLALYGAGPVAAPPAGNTSWENATPLGANDTVATDGIGTAGEARWYSVPVQPNAQVGVTLSGLAASTDIAVFSDIGQAFQHDLDTFGNGQADAQSLTALAAEQPTTTAAPAEFSPSAFTPSAFTPSAFTPSAFTPSAFTPSAFTPSAFTPSAFTPSAFTPSAFTPSAFTAAYSSAQVRSLLAISAQGGTATKSVKVNTWNARGHFYVRVTGHNGAFSSTPYRLDVASTGGPCDGVSLDTFSSDPTLVPAAGDHPSTLILTDSGRVSSPALGTALTNLASATQGTVIDLSGSTRVQHLQAQASAHPSCPYATNLVAEAIRDIVTGYRSGGALQYVVIAGGDQVVPYFRYADAAGLASEDGYVPPLTNTSRTGAALASKDFLTDDPYGAKVLLTTQNSTLPVPDLAVGRLIETAAEITGQIQRYLANPTMATPHSSLVTGYDFLQPVGDSVETALEAGMDDPAGATAHHDQLITNQGVPPTTTTASGTGRSFSWTADDLRSSLLGSHHDVVFLGGHFSANNTLAADYTSTLVTTDLQQAVTANPNLFAGSLVISAGCHAGYNIQDGDGVPGVTLGLDWPEAFSAAGATLISGTGYQYGDTDFIAYSDKLYVDLAKLLRSGTGPRALGRLLVAAKQQYLQEVPQLSGIDTKSLLTTTLYGLPMLGIDMPHGRAPITSPSTGVITPVDTTSDPGLTLGLRTYDLTTGTPTTEQHSAINDLSGSLPPGSQFTWLSGADGVTTKPGQPALPLQTQNVTSTRTSDVLRGVGLWSGTYTDKAGTIPLVGAPATETGQVHTPFTSATFFPQTLWSTNYFGALDGTGGTSLQLTPAQVQADGPSTDVLRAYQQLGLRLFYSGNTTKYGDNVPALAAAPTISQVSSQVRPDGSIDLTAHVAGAPTAGVHEVWATWTGSSSGNRDHGAWQSVDLVQDTNDSTLWHGTITPADPAQAADERFLVQAANGVGVVGLDNNGGALYTPGTTPGFTAPAATASTLALAGSPTSGVKGTTPNVSATLRDNAGNPIPGATVTFNLGSVTVAGTTDGGGAAQVALPLVVTPGGYTLSASFDGDQHNKPAADAHAFQVTAVPTSLTATATKPDVANGTATGVVAHLTSNGKALPGKTITFTVKSGATVVSTAVRTTDGNGDAPLGTVAVAPGPNAVTATFADEQDFLGSGGTTSFHGIGQTQTAVGYTPAGPTYGSPFTVQATVTPVATGKVSFTVDGTTACQNVSVVAGSTSSTASCQVTAALPVGAHTVTAQYLGDNDHQGSTGTANPSVAQATSSTQITVPATAVFGQPVPVSAKVTPTDGAGRYTFVVDGASAPSCDVAVSSTGTATCTVNGLGLGAHHITATFSGDTNVTTSSAAGDVSVSAASTTTTLTAPATAQFGTSVTLNASVVPKAPATGSPTGTVTFYNGSRVVGSATLVTHAGAASTASITVGGLLGGAASLKAVYSGTSQYTGSQGTATTNVTFTTTMSGSSSKSVTVAANTSVLISGSVGAGITVQKGGALEITGSINGSINATGATAVVLCGAKINGGITIGTSTGFVLIGGDLCGATSIDGSVTLSKNTGGIELAGSSINGSVNVSGNSGLGPAQINGAFPGPLIMGNKISGSLSCDANSPAPTNGGVPNTASSRSGQCSSPTKL